MVFELMMLMQHFMVHQIIQNFRRASAKNSRYSNSIRMEIIAGTNLRNESVPQVKFVFSTESDKNSNIHPTEGGF